MEISEAPKFKCQHCGQTVVPDDEFMTGFTTLDGEDYCDEAGSARDYFHSPKAS